VRGEGGNRVGSFSKAAAVAALVEDDEAVPDARDEAVPSNGG